jgi:hypothetical protein
MSVGSKKDEAKAIPTKQFFVSMLTRDINLADAILDLVDNCLDGALRVAGDTKVDYSRHKINICCNKDEFLIEDNCGGIPREIAMEYAFKLGRDPDDERDSSKETIGMYGVGMKRAIFKMGRNAIVQTRNGDDSFSVSISSAWLELKDWTPLPIITDSKTTKLLVPGTKIKVNDLYPGVSQHFLQKAFLDDLRSSLGEHFTLFIQRGLTINLNGNNIRPINVEVLVSENSDGPAPFAFKKTIDDVVVSIVVGLNTGRSSVDEDEDDFESDRSAITAGWSIFCNDRAIIIGDKNRLTGWGDGMPMYHPQYSVITGIVEFKSTKAEKLPVTTTKRALDTSSNIWLEARAKMREGMRVWITYTNAWKNHPRSDQSSNWSSAKPLQLEEAVASVLKRNPTVKQGGGLEYDPEKKGVLPSPKTKIPSSSRVLFSRPRSEIKEVSISLFGSPDEKPGIVGDECFSLVLEKIRSEKKS